MVSAATVVTLLCIFLSLSDPVSRTSAEPREWSLPLDLANHVKSSVVDQLDAATKLLQQFERFTMDFGRSYASLAEKMMRFEIFKENLKIIEELMASKRGSAKFGVGPFADMSAAEFHRKYFRRQELRRADEHSVQRRTPRRVSAASKKDPSDRGRRKKIILQNIDPFKTDPIPAKFSSPAVEPPVTGLKPTNPAFASPSTDSKPAVSPAVASSSTDPKPATSAVVPPSTGQKPVAPVLRHPVTGQIVPVIRHPVTGQIVPVVRHPVTGQIVPVARHPVTGPRPHPPGAARPIVGVKPLTVKPPLPERCLTRNGSYIKPPGPGYNRTGPPCAESPKVSPITKNVPRDVHWIESEFYPPPQDQNEANDSCGGCWAYASASVMEILVSRKLRQVIRLSKQQLLDCEKENNGCDGGDLQNGLHYIMETGLALERDYPFTGRGGGTCKNVSDKIIVRMLEMEFSDSTNEIISGLRNSPMPLSFYAPYGIQHYKEGVLDPPPENCTDKSMAHAAVIVGYNGDEVLIRNSWGPHWGINGNFWIKSGVCRVGLETFSVTEWVNVPV